MELSALYLPEFDRETDGTRKTLERVPEDKLEWKPHPKSMALGGLATHLANLVSWTSHTIEKDSLDIAPEGKPMRMEQATSRAALLAMFDKNRVAGRAAIAAASDAHLQKPWTLLHGACPIFTMPRFVVLRSFILNHMIHHRAQLGVYLRLNNIPVPSLYGPSADEGSM